MKTAIVCMVYNGHEYISEFIHYYSILSDHIYLIDHNSKTDLRALDLPNVTVVRSNQEAQLQSECTNLVIEHYKIKGNFDWVFVVDIDEFLPFKDRATFHNFLIAHKNDAVLQFHWGNGVPFYADHETPKSLIHCDSIRFFREQGRGFKSFVNINKTRGDFFVPTGAHHINYDLPIWRKKLSFLGKFKIYNAAISPLPLYHIVAFNKDAFVKKIKNYVEQMKYRQHIKGQGGWMVRDYPSDYTGDDWLWYIANFRVSDSQKLYEATRDDFIEHPIFAHLDRESVIALRERILTFPAMEKRPALEEEKKYLQYKTDDRDVMENIEWFSISSDNEFLTTPPPR